MNFWTLVRGVAVGILAAFAVLYVLVQLSQPSDSECAIQQADYALGNRADVDSGCR